MQLRPATKEEIRQFYHEEYNVKEIPQYITKNIHRREICIRQNRTRTKRQIQPIHTNQVLRKNNQSQSTICSILISSTI